jgi:hypothetical protein
VWVLQSIGGVRYGEGVYTTWDVPLRGRIYGKLQDADPFDIWLLCGYAVLSREVDFRNAYDLSESRTGFGVQNLVLGFMLAYPTITWRVEFWMDRRKLTGQDTMRLPSGPEITDRGDALWVGMDLQNPGGGLLDWFGVDMVVVYPMENVLRGWDPEDHFRIRYGKWLGSGLVRLGVELQHLYTVMDHLEYRYTTMQIQVHPLLWIQDPQGRVFFQMDYGGLGEYFPVGHALRTSPEDIQIRTVGLTFHLGWRYR